MNAEVESTFVRSFVCADKQERALILLNSKKKRYEFHWKLESLLDRQYFHEYALGFFEEGCEILRGLGAPDNCYVLSLDDSLDGKRIPLEEAFRDALYSRLRLIICVPDQLAYYHDKNGRKYVLRR